MQYDVEIREINLKNEKEISLIKNFLATFNLKYENDITYTVGLFYNDEIIGTGSVSGKILKCIAVLDKYQGEGLTAKLISHLIQYQYQKNIFHRFIFTKPENVILFKNFGFKEIIIVEDSVALLENGNYSIEEYLQEKIKATEEKFNKKYDFKNVGAIVVNCNPITKGHLYLIETAASQCELLHLFVVSEEKSLFPTEVRFRLIKESTKHIKNIVIHHGGDYIISSATFPAYFAKEGEETKLQTVLDISVFGRRIAPALNISKRFVGEEPYCNVTKTYNETMKKFLPIFGIELIEIKRKEIDGDIISASKVREFIRKDDFESIKKYATEETYKFLISEEAKYIIEKIKATKSRH